MKFKEILRMVLPYVGVFIISLIITGFVINRSQGVERFNTDNATLPVLFMEKNEEKINLTRGYKGDMDELNLRNWVYPMNSDGIVTLVFHRYGNNIKGVSYEAMEYSGRNVIASGKVEDLKEDDKYARGTIDLSTKIKDNREYFLRLKVSTGGGDCTFCTRIMYPENRDYIEALDFAKEFHKTTFNKNADTAISNLLEVRTNINNNDLSYVNIGSSYDNITWSTMEVSYYTEPEYNISEINDSFVGITATYILQVKDGERVNLCDMKEYYRVRKSDGKMYLLDYERHMEQIFDVNNVEIRDNSILLGITSSSNDVKLSDGGASMAFVADGELFTYSGNSGRICKVFGFLKDDITDLRASSDNHEIKIVKVEESGSLDFAVIGQQNSGQHEGETGIGLYSYSAQTRQVTEEIFIKMDMPYQLIKEMMGKILYVNNHNELYITYDKNLYKIDVRSKRTETIAKDLTEDLYSVSADGSIVAISNSKSLYDITEIKVLNLDTGREYIITAPGDSKVTPIGFLGVDLVYGVARNSDIQADSVGNKLFLMNKITIANDRGDIKEYDQGGYLVSKAYLEGTKIMLKRVHADSRKEATDDSIVNMKENNKISNAVTMVNVGARKQQKAYTYAGPTKIPEKIEVMECSYAKNGDNTMENPFGKPDSANYYAFAAGEICGVSTETNIVIASANNASGVVLDSNGKYIWIKGSRARQKELGGYDASGRSGSSYAICLTLMLNNIGVQADVQSMLDAGKTPLEILRESTKTNIINLSGCGLDCALNFISDGAPVFAINQSDQAMLITAYDIYNITVLSPAERTTSKISLDDARKLFDSAGNLFLTYKR